MKIYKIKLTNSFLQGMRSLSILGGFITKNSYCKTDKEAYKKDFEAIRKDWEIVGDDLKKNIQKTNN